MIIPLRKQAPDEHQAAPLRYGIVWSTEGMSITQTRHAARLLLARAGHPPSHTVSQDAQIVVSELVTNALRHAPGPGGLLLEVTEENRLRITVRDGSPDRPVLLAPDRHRVGGHGLHLVARLCTRFDTRPTRNGKQVTAELALPDPVG